MPENGFQDGWNYALAEYYAGEAIRLAALADGLAYALAMGKVDAGDVTDARDVLRAHLHQAEAYRQAASLIRFRDGMPVPAWPARAPWAGL